MKTDRQNPLKDNSKVPTHKTGKNTSIFCNANEKRENVLLTNPKELISEKYQRSHHEKYAAVHDIKKISSRQTISENGPKISARWSVKIFSITGTSDNTCKMREKTSLKQTNFDQIVFRCVFSFFLSLSSTRRQELVHLPKSSTVALVR